MRSPPLRTRGSRVSPKYYPERKPRQRSWPARDRAAQKQFREAVLKQAGTPSRCQYGMFPGGTRCTITGDENLVAHHCEPGNPDPATGLALCRPHHRELDVHAR